MIQPPQNPFWCSNNLVVAGGGGFARTFSEEMKRQDTLDKLTGNVRIVLDLPHGYAMNLLEETTDNNFMNVVITWNYCPEYWEDLWDLNPNVLLVDDGLELSVPTLLFWAEQGCRRKIVPDKPTILTKTERRILQMVARNYPNCAIAEKLLIEYQTVKNMASSMYQKLGVTNRHEASLYYWSLYKRSDLV